MGLKAGWEYLGQKNTDPLKNFSISVDDIVSKLDMRQPTEIVLKAYHDQGYHNGDFETSHFELDTSSSANPAAVLIWPTYTKFMLYGRGPGKMPPIEPIAGWMRKYGISVSPWGVAKNIAKYGTTNWDGYNGPSTKRNTDFITPIIPTLSENFKQQLKTLLEEELAKLK